VTGTPEPELVERDIADLFVRCSYPVRPDALAASDTCQDMAPYGVKDPAVVDSPTWYRCAAHMDYLPDGQIGVSVTTVMQRKDPAVRWHQGQAVEVVDRKGQVGPYPAHVWNVGRVMVTIDYDDPGETFKPRDIFYAENGERAMDGDNRWFMRPRDPGAPVITQTVVEPLSDGRAVVLNTITLRTGEGRP
jgi:hypothetical protein